jgi:selenium metabolism protein YedF
MQRLEMTGEPNPTTIEKTQEALAEAGAGGVQVLVDNRIAVQELEKLADGMECGFAFRPFGEGAYLVTIEKKAAGAAAPAAVSVPAAAGPAPAMAATGAPAAGTGLTVLVTKNGVGTGSKELSQTLAKGFIASLARLPVAPEALIFMNGGVMLASEGSPATDDLAALSARGCEIIACNTCVEFFGLEGKLVAGKTADMAEITARLAEAARVLSV